MNSLHPQYPFNKKFLVIAHRGASHHAPENTMAAFRLAQEMEADMIELDIQLSKDGIPVVFHDEDLRNTSNGRGSISSFTLKELKELDAGSWFSSGYSGEEIPVLEEVLHWANDTILLNIEIKPEAVTEKATGGVEEKVIAWVQSFNMQSRVILSSFDYRAVQRFKEIDPEIATGLLFNKKLSKRAEPVELLELYNADFFHCSRREISDNWIKQLNREKRPYLIYTVNQERQMRKLIHAGAYGIFSDKPDLLKRAAEKIL